MRSSLCVGVGCAVALAACGGTATKRTKVFASPGMRIHFSYPASFSSRPLSYEGRKFGRTPQVIAAIGIAPEDLILVSLTPLSRAVTSSEAKPALDLSMTQVAGRSMSGTVDAVSPLLTVSYPRIPVPGLPGVTSRVIFVISGLQKYELQCQATAKNLGMIDTACDEALATVSVS